MNRLKEEYKNKIVPEIMKEFKLKNVMEVPSVEKININAGIGSFRENKEAVESFAASCPILPVREFMRERQKNLKRALR